jgi:hypothetical protein
MTTALRTPSLADTEQVTEGDCPSCGSGPWALTAAGQVPEHDRPGRAGHRRRCPCSGWLARNPRPRRPFYVEGVRFL